MKLQLICDYPALCVTNSKYSRMSYELASQIKLLPDSGIYT